MGFHHVGQTGLKILSSSNPPHLGLQKCWDYRRHQHHFAHCKLEEATQKNPGTGSQHTDRTG
ncbi:hypothetical protein AAY473_020057 [Plecturocebus cupreus]